jgi:hypothetical protein
MDSRDRDSNGRRAAPQKGRKRRRTVRKARTANMSNALRDFDSILGRFNDAMCVLGSALRALEERSPGSEAHGDAVTLRHGLDMLGEVYTKLDLTIGSVRP